MDNIENKVVIELKDIHKTLGGKDVFTGVNLSFRRGETIVIIGRSGEGKSVLLKHIIGLMQPDSGQVIVEGEDITRLDEQRLVQVREKINMLFQNSALFDSLSVEENVAFSLYEHTKLSREDIRQRVEENLHMVKLEGVLEKMPADLSGGMRKRVALARAIITRPKIILYDEPTTGLDPITADSINELILSLQDQLGVTSVVVTHDMASAFKVADRVAFLNQGKIIAVGSVDEIQQSGDSFVQQFIQGKADESMTNGFSGN
jgi:phospholipid/cholesterol/gamma-HCH transport system ATP-binding protein